MPAFRLDRVAAGTVLALALSASHAISPAAEERSAIETGVAASEPASVTAPSISDADRPTALPVSVAPTASVSPANAAPTSSLSETEISSRIPVPEPADVPPVSKVSIGIPSAAPSDSAATSSATAALPSAQDDAAILSAIPFPEPANVPPPTIKDIGKAPLGMMAAADLPVAEKLRDLITGKLDRFLDRKADRLAIETFYKSRGFVPLFIENGSPSPRMKAAIARLKAADSDGLDAKDYFTPDLKAAGLASDALAEAELKLVNSVLAYARHAAAGRVSSSRISNNMEFTPTPPEPASVLTQIAESKDAAKTLDEFNPPHEGFRALKAKLAELWGKSGETDLVHVPNGRTLKKGMQDARVPLLRERLGIASDAADTTYDAAVAEAVKEFQKHKGLAPTGVLNNGTAEALNGRSRSRDIDVVVSNMERWRWLPRDLGKAYVMVNIPDFTLKLVHNGATIFRTRIVVGKPGTPTPSFSTKMENILVNPTWHVPESIIYNEYLPALQQDPTVLARMGLVVERTREGRIAIRQPPGERNALGRIKFNIPNRFQVYLHDTPDKNLFAHERRAYSHGCMRVQNPTQFGEALLAIATPQEHYTAERLQRLFGTGEQWLKFKNMIPVHLVYMNAYVDEAGKLVIRDDLYGYDGRVRAALRGDGLPVIAERSQIVRPEYAGRRSHRRVVQEQPQRGWFLFPFFQ